LATAEQLSQMNVDYFRVGLWKPRTRPNTFEGVGEKGLKWLQKVQRTFGMKIVVEAANTQHVEAALNAGIDALWIGARTTTNPFAVQQIADALRGVNLPVLVKNPVSPDVELWLGAIERLQNAGIQQIMAVHRGFGGGDAAYRNSPQWHVPIELRRRLPNIPLLCDPSHIAGKKELVSVVAQQAIDLNYSGLMLEVHCNPQQAKSDAEQQITPAELRILLKNLVFCTENPHTENLSALRRQIDDLDRNLVEILAQRLKTAQQIGDYKRKNNISILQSLRYNEVLQNVINQAISKNLNPDFIKKIMEIIHEEAIKRQL
jgi:chorismate mutase